MTRIPACLQRTIAGATSILGKTSQSVDTSNIHGARSTDSLSAGSPKGQTWIHLVLDLDESIKHHGATIFQVNLIILHFGLSSWLLGVPSVDSKSFLLFGPEAPGSLFLSLAAAAEEAALKACLELELVKDKSLVVALTAISLKFVSQFYLATLTSYFVSWINA